MKNVKLDVDPEVMGEGVQVGHASESAQVGHFSDDASNDAGVQNSSSDEGDPNGSPDEDDRNRSPEDEPPVNDSEGLETSDGQEVDSDPETAEDGAQGRTEDAEGEEDADKSFPKPYVDKLRKEAADNRAKAKRTDDLAARLHTALVQATGKLADPADLPFDESHLDDAEALDAAIEELISQKPHLASRTPRGNIGQGVTATAEDDFSLAGWLGGMTR